MIFFSSNTNICQVHLILIPTGVLVGFRQVYISQPSYSDSYAFWLLIGQFISDPTKCEITTIDYQRSTWPLQLNVNQVCLRSVPCGKMGIH